MTEATTTLAAALEDGAKITVVGQIAWSSNGTFLVDVATANDEPLRAIYKPQAGERPLGDFQDGIWRREVAAHWLARELGWDCIPETVPVTGPYGIGSLQRFIDVDYSHHYFTMIDDGTRDVVAQLRRLCCFDLVANNTDRKAGHCLLDGGGHVWGIDNALCFHAQFKLRTVIWDFAGEAIDPTLLDDLARLVEAGLPEAFSDLLDPFERDALRTRAGAVVASGRFPHDPTGRRYPWPLI